MSPERPRTVPEGARYDPLLPGWDLSSLNAQGVRHGECRLYRDDGSLERIASYDSGKRVGPFSSFHANGDVASRGRYDDDRLDGTVVRFASQAPGAEPLRACCVPRGAVELRAEYRSGRLLTEVYYDRQGRPLGADGTPWPERPPGVPAAATYDEGSSRFCERIEADDGSRATVRYFDQSGVRREELTLEGGRAVGRRRFDGAGNLSLEQGLDRGVPHGPSRERFADGASPYGDARVREVRGELVQGEASGRWELLDQHDAVILVVERGAPFVDPPASVVDAEPQALGPVELLALAREARSSGHAREAVCLAARATARARDPEPLRSFLRESALPLAPLPAAECAEMAAGASDATASRLLDALLAGGDPARLLRALPAVLPRSCHASLEYLDAALLLAPERTLARISRALVRAEHGDVDGALADADAVAAVSAPAAEVIREECRVAFPAYLFDPLEHPVEEPEDELLGVGVEQPLAAVRWAIALYATRLTLLRAELERRVGAAPWLPPDLRALIPEGPVELRRFTATIREEAEEGVVEETEVSVDETVSLDGSVRQLLERARADYAALGWLCWSAGLDEVRLPTELSPRALFAAAANRATLRCFFAHDRVRTGGLVAMARKVPRFAWEGLAIDSLPRHLAEVAALEYLEIRAQFLWLFFAENVSPFQADLRKV